METVETTATRTFLTPEEYLARERKALDKSEYRDGQIYTMPGASRKHNLITANTLAELHVQLRNRICEVYSSDMRVKVSSTGRYTYPDVVVVCEEPHFEDSHFDTLLNPTVLIEVLSPSTAAYDRGDKFASYQKLDSLCEYVLISQDNVCVEHYLREGQTWDLTEFRSFNDMFSLVSINCELSLQAIYAKVQFSQE
ncbi:MAG: Uma2 family endonuclease [Candidatus Poribacteria bacterium]|nr:Uma2 family endonuclease [Candidatus Poribacteria bacterium]